MNEHLTVDIYYDKYPPPKLVGLNHVDEVSRISAEPRSNVVSVQTSNVPVGESQTQTKTSSFGGCALICSMLICIGIGVMCIMIALEKNEPSEEYMIKLEGNIIYVFYLGVGILFCVGVCIFGAVCAQCLDICMVLK